MANAVRKLFSGIGVQVLFIERGSPWEDGYNESIAVELRDTLLNKGILLHANGRAFSHKRRKNRVRIA